MQGTQRFIDIGAVEAWDAWFRWRQDGELRDVSIEQTWSRVAGALAAPEQPGQAAPFQRQLVDALLGWKLLPDERIAASAGTAAPAWPDDGLVAVLNAANFVYRRFDAAAGFDHAAFAATAALAVRMLDNAALLAGRRAVRARSHARIGLVGLADALYFLGLPYDSPAACAQARRIAHSLAEGCLQGDLQLARERGGHPVPEATPAAPAPAWRAVFDQEQRRHGRRHARLTAIGSQRRLALLANNVADAVDPLCSSCAAGDMPCSAAARTKSPAGYAFILARRRLAADGSTRVPACTPVTAAAQLDMRAAMQAWIDQPIDYPLAHPGRDACMVSRDDRSVAGTHGQTRAEA